MTPPNVEELDIDAMLEKAEVTVRILRVVYNLQFVDGYKKEHGSQELIKLLHDMTYLDHPLELRKEGKV